MRKSFINICAVCLAVCATLCMGSVSVIDLSAASAENEYKYIDYFKEYYTPYFEDSGKEFYTDYAELYEYYANKTTSDEATPDLVLAFCSEASEFCIGDSIFGDYFITSSLNYPYFSGLHVLTLDDGKIYTLIEAYDANIDGIYDMLEEIYVSGNELGWVSLNRIGDVDYDHKITVKDATMMQKCIAGLENFKDDIIYYDEYNMRGYEWKTPETKDELSN